MPNVAHPDLLVGFDTSDDAGVFRVSDHIAIVQTMDFFTPIVDEPYAYGSIAAANALSDVYAMGGRPITAMNIACFDPQMAPAQVWADILRGMADKCEEAGAILVGGHTVEDKQPKFGLSVTGIVDPDAMFDNRNAEAGDRIYLTKPLGMGIATTAAKFDDPLVREGGEDSTYATAIRIMAELNRTGAEFAHSVRSRCATDITGFGLAGHLFNIARASGVTIRIHHNQLPLLPHIERLIEAGNVPAGARKNAAHLGDALEFSEAVPTWMRTLVTDPQTSGGLAVFSKMESKEYPLIGTVEPGTPRIIVD